VCSSDLREIYGYDHGVLAAHVLRAWSIPAPIPDVIALHHQPKLAERANENVQKLVAIVRIADQLSYLDAEDDTLQARDHVAESDISVLGMDGPTIDLFWQSCAPLLFAESLDHPG
jgi:HD-like signal output (HDOD) protein